MSQKESEPIDVLRAKSKRITPQRRLILQIIQEHKGHLDADEIHVRARERYPRLSLSTVYRTLDLLRKLGLVKELGLATERRHYEVKPREEHQHLICLGCGKVIEFQCAHSLDIHRDLADQHGFQMTGSRVELWGYCPECAIRKKEVDYVHHHLPGE